MKERRGRLQKPHISRYAIIFKALSDETRLRIFLLLGKGELCVCHIQEALGTTQTKVSRHLGVLRNAGLVTSRREGLWMYYRRSEPGPPELRAFLRDLARILDNNPGPGTPEGNDERCTCKGENGSYEKKTCH